MIKHKRLSALAILLILGIAVLATSGIAYASWVWCDDPSFSVGNSTLGYNSLYVEYAVSVPAQGNSIVPNDNFHPSLNITVPQGTDVKNIDPQGWDVSWTAGGTPPYPRALPVSLDILVVPKPESPYADSGDNVRVKVVVALDPQFKRVLGEKVGHVGDHIVLDNVMVPIPAK